MLSYCYLNFLCIFGNDTEKKEGNLWTLWVWVVPWVAHLWCPGSVGPDRDRRSARAASVREGQGGVREGQEYFRKCQEMSGRVRKMSENGSECRNISGNVRKCQEMSRPVWAYQSMSWNARKCQEYVKKISEIPGTARKCHEYVRKMSGLYQERPGNFKTFQALSRICQDMLWHVWAC